MRTTPKTKRISSGPTRLKLRAADVADVAWQPWFLPKQVSQKIVQIIPPGYRKRFRFHFDDYGCLRCRRKDIAYRSLGFCENCHSLITKEMRRSMRRHRREIETIKTDTRVHWYLEEIDRAQELLADFLPQQKNRRTDGHLHLVPRMRSREQHFGLPSLKGLKQL